MFEILEPLLQYRKRAATSDFQQCGMCSQQRLRPACTYTQSDQSICLSLEYSTTLRLLTEHHLEYLSLKGGCTGSSESTLVKMPRCWKSRYGSDVIFYFFSLTLECADEDGMRYRSVMSSLLQEYGGVSIYVKAQILCFILSV